MRILAVTPYYLPEGGGLERYAHEVLTRLVRRGHEVVVLTNTRDEPEETVVDGVIVKRRSAAIFVGNTPVDPGFSRWVRKTIDRHWPDLVVAHTPVPFPAEMAYRAARHRGIPFVTTYHAGRLRGSSRLLDAMATMDRMTLERKMLAGSDRLVAVSPFVRDNALKRAADRVTIVPPGVDTQRFEPGDAVDENSVLFVGPLSNSYRWKGVDALWKAFEQVAENDRDARLVLVGHGDRYDEFAKKARHMGDVVRMPGRLPLPQLIEEYQRAGMVVLPSTTDAESFGMVLAEANACGRPVIGSRIGGIPFFVRHGENGLLAGPGDVDDLAAKIHMVLDDGRLRAGMGLRGRRRVVQDHDWNKITEKTENVYFDAVTGKQD